VTLAASVTDNSECLSEKPLGCFHIPFLAQSRINQIAIRVNGPIEVAPSSLYFEVGLIYIPGFSCLATSLCPQLVCNEWSKPRFPLPDGLMRELPSAFQKHFGQIDAASTCTAAATGRLGGRYLSETQGG
jgi:hypothetical protein